jgi:heptosyltransferase-2
MKILIIRFSSIGDVVLTTPVLRCLKLQVPGVELHYLTKPGFKILLEHNPYVHQIHYLDKHPIAKGYELRKEHFDVVIDLHHNLRTAMIKGVLGVKAYSFPKLNVEKFLAVNFKIFKLPAIHIVDRYLQTTQSLGVKNDGAGLDYFIPEADYVLQFNGFKPKENKYYTWAIGAQHFTKRLPNQRVIDLAQKLSYPIVLLGGKEDQVNAAIIAEALGKNCINACGQLNLNQSAFMVQHSMHLYTNDTGMMHIAAALKVPITSFWGNTLPEFGMSPYYGEQQVEQHVVEVKGLSCRPCSKIGFDRCPKGHFKCMAHSTSSG